MVAAVALGGVATTVVVTQRATPVSSLEVSAPSASTVRGESMAPVVEPDEPESVAPELREEPIAPPSEPENRKLSVAPKSRPSPEQNRPRVAAPPVVDEAPAKVVPVAAPVESKARSSSTGDLRAEHALLRRARTSLRKGDALDSLAAIREHAKRFPEGTLAQERDVLEILSLCARDRTAAARVKAEAFVARYPGSPLAARLRNSCVE